MLAALDCYPGSVADTRYLPSIVRDQGVGTDGNPIDTRGLVDAFKRRLLKTDAKLVVIAPAAFSGREVEIFSTPVEKLTQQHQSIIQKYRKAFDASNARLDSLKSEALSCGQVINPLSEKDMIEFLKSRIFVRRPFITLLDNGNLRAIWKSADGEQIGLQFRGNKTVQYVLFSRREDVDIMARSAGRDTVGTIWRQIEMHKLERLMTA